MSSETNLQPEEFRHERKFLITDRTAAEVEQIVRYNPACFSEIFHERSINNIYFDTPGFSSYYGNVEGDPDRMKPRIRWYGKLEGGIRDAVLEFKIKKGLLGRKTYYKMHPFTLSKEFSRAEIINAMSGSAVPADVYDYMRAVWPVLLNRYSRKYFLSADKRFRLTIDKELEFYRINYSGNTFLNHVKAHNDVVLELKYDVKYESEARAVATALPFALTKNSKYVSGLERVLF